MPDGTVTINPAIELSQSDNGTVISFPDPSGLLGGIEVTFPSPQLGNEPFDLHFSYGVFISLPGTSVGSVEFPNQPFELPIPQSGIGLIDLPHGGNLRVTIPNVLTRDKLKVTVKSGDRARLFTEAAAM